MQNSAPDNESLELKDDEGRTPLNLAASRGDVDACVSLIARGANLESKDNNGFSPLACAAYGGKTETCVALIEHGANLESKDNSGFSPLALAAERCNTETCVALIDHGADLESKNVFGESPLTVTTRTGETETCIALINHGANLESKNHEGRSPLFIAACEGNVGPCVALIDRGADLKTKDKDGHSPLDWAATREETRTFLTLTARGADGLSDISSKYHHSKSMIEAIKYPLHCAAKLEMTKECVQMLDRGYSPAEKNSDGFTPAQAAENAGKDEAASAIRSWITRQAANSLLNEMLCPVEPAAEKTAPTSALTRLAERNARQTAENVAAGKTTPTGNDKEAGNQVAYRLFGRTNQTHEAVQQENKVAVRP